MTVTATAGMASATTRSRKNAQRVGGGGRCFAGLGGFCGVSVSASRAREEVLIGEHPFLHGRWAVGNPAIPGNPARLAVRRWPWGGTGSLGPGDVTLGE